MRLALTTRLTQDTMPIHFFWGRVMSTRVKRDASAYGVSNGSVGTHIHAGVLLEC